MPPIVDFIVLPWTLLVVKGGLIVYCPPGLIWDVVMGGALGLGPVTIGGPLMGPGPAIGLFNYSYYKGSYKLVVLPP
jgi:hypothetical protein